MNWCSDYIFFFKLGPILKCFRSNSSTSSHPLKFVLIVTTRAGSFTSRFAKISEFRKLKICYFCYQIFDETKTKKVFICPNRAFIVLLIHLIFLNLPSIFANSLLNNPAPRVSISSLSDEELRAPTFCFDDWSAAFTPAHLDGDWSASIIWIWNS